MRSQPDRAAYGAHRQTARHALLAVCFALACTLPAAADVFHLKNGGTVEGELIEQTDIGYRVRTSVGIITLPLDAVDRIESTETPFAEYDRRRDELADTAAAHFELAEWCRSVDLRAERRRHLMRAIELEPDFVPAREALGYVRINGLWVDGRSEPASQPAAESAPATQPATAPATPEEEERLIQSIQTEWYRRIRAIRQHLVESSTERLALEGRRRILEINDPLAILPMTRVLSAGNRVSREVLVAALSQFPLDEATLNLSMIALADDDAIVRRAALLELQRRSDPRVIPQFREALYTDNDHLIRRAAVALGMLDAKEAVLDLMEVLTAQRRRLVEVPVTQYFLNTTRAFDRQTTLSFGGFTTGRYRPAIGINLGPSAFPQQTTLERREVTVFRTEVLEALRTITGQNFGFEAAEWRRWHEEQHP